MCEIVQNKTADKQSYSMKSKLFLGGLLVSAAISFAAIFDMKSANPEEGTELVFALMVHRHGDRTPTRKEDMVDLNLFNGRIDALIEKWGYGQITDAGLRTIFKTGEFIRRRYDGLISPKYNDSEIYIRSSDVTRSKVSVLGAMAAVFRPVGEIWSKDINWVPVPYTTVPAKEDFMQPWSSCPKFLELFTTFNKSPTILRTDKNKDLVTKLIRLLDNKDIGTVPLKIIQTYDFCTSLISMGYDIGGDLLDLYPELSSAANDLWDYLFSQDDNMRQIIAGVLLNEFLVHANDIISGKETNKVRVYSAHDITVTGLESVTGVAQQGIPNYGGLYSLELRRNVDTRRYYVLPVYLSDPHDGVEKYLQVEGCGKGFLCDYEQFSEIVAKYRLDEDAWKNKCSVENIVDCDGRPCL